MRYLFCLAFCLVSASVMADDDIRIIGQKNLTTMENTSIKLQLEDIIIKDQDKKKYPQGFTLRLYAGLNYTVSGLTVIPRTNFTGILSVPVRVLKGSDRSNKYVLKIEVLKNQRPVVTGQLPISLTAGQQITVLLTHLIVTDSDNKYPDDFSLSVFNGENYTLSNATVRPSENFIGTLTVRVTVNDGKADSEPFNMKIEVVPKAELHITGQVPLATPEDSIFEFRLSYLMVYDPDDRYPHGFTLNILPGSNYTANGHLLKPDADFNGNLTVKVTVAIAGRATKPFPAVVKIKPVNDPAVLSNLDARPLFVSGAEPQFLARRVKIADVDDTELVSAQVVIQPDAFQAGSDELTFETTENIKGIFDTRTGSLLFEGKASFEEYEQVLQSVSYHFSGEKTPAAATKSISFILNDGKTISDSYVREVAFHDNTVLIIPSGFTPNNDRANDTWRITPAATGDWENNTILRVYNKRGLLVYQTQSLEHEWDGRLNGELLPADTYYYTIELRNTNNHNKISYRGVVTILY